MLGLVLSAALGLFAAAGVQAGEKATAYTVERFLENPIITPAMMNNAAEDINGPKLIKAPDWLPGRLGKYYLYFAHHEGKYIRLAYADDLHGPWKIHQPGVLPIDDPLFTWKPDHIASPEVVVDEENHQLILYFHTPTEPMPPSTDPNYIKMIDIVPQETFVATSPDGINFKVRPERLGKSYFKVWKWQGYTYALGRLGTPLYRSKTGFAPFEELPSPLDKNPAFKRIRHVGLLLEKDLLTVFYTKIGDSPEAIKATTIRLTPNPGDWTPTPPVPVLESQTGYEGVALPVEPSKPGSTIGFEHAVRDPDVYQEGKKLYLLYSVEGERGIAIGEVKRKIGK
jgi:hypothetical protein